MEVEVSYYSEDRVNRVTSTTNDYVLVEKARGGDQVAFLLLYERHRSAIFRFVYRLSGSVEVAEDITHDCFLSLARESGKFLAPATAPFRIQLYSTARARLIRYFHDSLQEPSAGNIPVLGPVSRGEQPNAAMPEESASAVRVAVGNLPFLEREALVLFEYEFLKVSQIAMIAGTDDETILARLERARQRLRETLMSGAD